MRPCRLLPVLSLALGLSFCGREPSPTPPPVWRPLDHPESLALRSQRDLSAPEAWDELLVAERTRLALLDPDEANTAAGPEVAALSGEGQAPFAHDGRAEWLEEEGERTLRLVGPAAAWIDLPDATIRNDQVPYVRVRAAASQGTKWRLVIARRGPPAGDRAAVLRQLRHGGIDQVGALRPEGGVRPGEPAWFRRRRDPKAHERLGVLVQRGTVTIGAAEQVRLTRLGDELALSHALPGRPAFVRRVALLGDHREACLVPVGGVLEVKLDGRGRFDRLRFAFGCLGSLEHVRLRATLGPGASEGETVWSYQPEPGRAPPRRFVDAEVDLAGRTGDTLSFHVEGTGEGGLAAIAHPTLIRRRAARRPLDVVVVSLDTVRADRLSLYGAARPTSPRLEALGREATVFDAAVAPSSWTLPSHVTVFSGWLPDHHQVIDAARRIPDQAPPLLADILRRRGYRCVALTAGGFVAPELGFARGFEEYRIADPVEPRHLPAGPAHLWSKMARFRLHELLAEQRGDDEPLLLFVHTYAAHEYAPASEDLARLGVEGPRAERAMAVSLATMRKLFRRDPASVPEEELRHLTDRYDATLLEADRLVGDIVDDLRRSGRLDHTLLVVFSDHGEELGERGGFGHAHALHEELIHVPLLMRAPGAQPRRVPDVVSLADVAPTVLDLLGLPPPADCDGRSLAPFLRGGALPPRPALAACGAPWQSWIHALRGARWKLVRTDTPGRPRSERLYDLAGAGEDRDVSSREPDRTRRLSERLDALLERLRGRRLEAAESTLSEARRRELEALGYLGGG